MRGIASFSGFTSLRCLLFRPPQCNSRYILPRNTPFKPPGSSQTDATPVVVSEDDSFGKKQGIGLTPQLYDNVFSNVRKPLVPRQLREEKATISLSQMEVLLRQLREKMTTMSESEIKSEIQVLRQLKEKTITISESDIQEHPFYVLVQKADKLRGVIEKMPSKFRFEFDRMVASLSTEIEAAKNDVIMYGICTIVSIFAVGIAVVITTPEISIRTSSEYST